MICFVFKHKTVNFFVGSLLFKRYLKEVEEERLKISRSDILKILYTRCELQVRYIFPGFNKQR